MLLGIAALPVAFSAWIDPARLVAPRATERDIARVLAAGSNVTNYANYDDRAIERSLATNCRGVLSITNDTSPAWQTAEMRAP